MTLLPGIERAGSRRPIGWFTVIGVLLLPVVLGGILVAALYNPVERLDSVSAAVVNDDRPVEVDGQLVPLGRQLTAGLIEGSDDLPSNLDWTITNDEDAEAGIADGTYAAVITIPENFSAAATSTAPGSTPEQATIQVTTPPDSRVVDDAISSQVARAAASLTGSTLSTTYLENVFLGFTTLGEQLGTAADGARGLAEGATSAAEGANALSGGVEQLSTGADGLAGGASRVDAGARSLAGGAAQLSNGATQLATGADQAAGGVERLAGGLQQTASESAQLAEGLQAIAGGLSGSGIPTISADVVTAAQAISANSEQVNARLASAAHTLRTLAASCDRSVTPDTCDQLTAASDALAENLAPVQNLVGDAGTIVTGLSRLPELGANLQTLANGATALSGGIGQLADGASQAADGVRQVSTGAVGLATGAQQLATGAGGLSSGAGQLSSGASQLATGAESAATGASDLAGGVEQLSDGSSRLAEGLTQAADAVPSYTDSEASQLASVVADPVAAHGVGTNLFGATAIPLLATVALWFGGLGTFVALRAVTARAVSSRRPSLVLALRALAPAAVIGALQGLLVAVVVQFAASYDWGDWSLFAALSVVAGIAFSTVHQALVAVFGGVGRWIAATVGVLAIASGIVSTVPGVLLGAADMLPTAPAYHGLVAALTDAGGLGAAVSGLAVWSLLALVATTIAISRRRGVPVRELLAP